MQVQRLDDDKFILVSGSMEVIMDFVKLSELKEQVDQMYSDEQSRILMESLTGDYTCDGCTI